jgi:PleD family two-component response regulator
MHIREVGFHPSFSGTRFFVTKFVKRRSSHSSTHISQNTQHALLYITKMQGGPHILIVDDHREIRDLVSRALTKRDSESARRRTAALCKRS